MSVNSFSVVILGNSSAARECYWLARQTWGEAFRFKGFLAFEGFRGELRELAGLEKGSDEAFTPAPEDAFIIGIGSPALRRKAFLKWKGRGARFMNLVHPTVSFLGEILPGESNILGINCVIGCNAAIGHNNFLNGAVNIGHDARVGDHNFFGPSSLILGEVRVGSGNAFGAHSVALPKAKIGNDNSVAPGSYIYKGCGNNCLMAGNPALNMDR